MWVIMSHATAIDVLHGRASWAVDVGDTRRWLKTLPADSVHCIVTSPPYFGLRDYGTAQWDGGDPACDHKADTAHQKQGASSLRAGRANVEAQRNENIRGVCSKCGAVRADEQLGLEETPEQYVANMTEVFRECRRVLRPDGCLWLNLGDSYWNHSPTRVSSAGAFETVYTGGKISEGSRRRANGHPTLKMKDLIGIPWMTAFALRADGWYLRQWMPWVRRNPIPESAEDRPSSACEIVFLLTKSSQYFFDMEAVKSPVVNPARLRRGRVGGNKINATKHSDGSEYEQGETRNLRSGDLWFDSVGLLISDGQMLGFDVPVRGRKEAHFAIMADRLAEPMVLAGTSARGVCPECGAPWARVVEKERVATRPGDDTKATGDGAVDGNRDPERHVTRTKTTGWQPGCECHGRFVDRKVSRRVRVIDKADNKSAARIEMGMNSRKTTLSSGGFTGAASHEEVVEDTVRVFESDIPLDKIPVVPAIVLDPFMGSGTTAAVAVARGRCAVGVELNPEHAEIARRRIAAVPTGFF